MKKIILASVFSIITAQPSFSQELQALITPQVSKLFIIQNIATEKVRVYERCDITPGCPHRLIFESDMVVGRPESGTDEDQYAFVTQLGHSRIKSWIKYYQDKNGHYPHWYKEGQSLDSIPPRAPRDKNGEPIPEMNWGKKWMREKSIYGAFGWYAAILTPSNKEDGVNYQWIHGTIGWASDKNAPIELTRSWFLNIISDPGSSGCTRLSNDKISYLRHILPAGTDVFRVYAHEATRENSCEKKSFWGTSCKKEKIFEAYKDQINPLKWNYTMLTNEANKTNGITADTETIEKLGIEVKEGENLIEKGTAEINQYPHAVSINYRNSPSSGKSGDRYSIDDPTGDQQSKFQGVFMVDEGKFIDYQHPKSELTNGVIRIGGLADFKNSVPEILTTNGQYFQVPPVYLQKNNH